MNKFTLKSGVTAGCLLVASATMAAEQFLEVDDFTGLGLGTGIVGKVSCGNSNTVTLEGDKKTLDKIKVSVVNNELSIERKSSGFLGNIMSNDEKSNSVEATIVTRGQLSVIDASTGSMLSVEGCAVNSSAMEINASTGSTLSVDGQTANLELEMSTGSQFNSSKNDFTAEIVDLSMSTGAIANLCRSTTISGSASTGAIIYAGSNTDVSDISLSLGADTSSRRCN